MAAIPFVLFTPLFKMVDKATVTFVTEISTNAIATATPYVVIGLTLTFISMGILVILGTVQMPVMEFLKRSVGIGLICSIALAGGLYQSQLADTIVTLPDDMAKSLLTSNGGGAPMSIMIDDAANKGFVAAGDAFDKAGIFAEHGIIYAGYGFLIVLTTAIVVGLGGAYILLAKVALALLVGLGPLFILALLWRPLSGMFQSWLGQVLTYVLLVVLVAAIFSFMISIFSTYLGGLKLDGSQSIGTSLGGVCVLAVVMTVLLMKLPAMAAGLAHGFSLSYLWELRAIKGGAQAGYSMGKSAARTGYAVDKAGYAAGRAGVVAAGRGVASAGRAVGNYYRGKKAA